MKRPRAVPASLRKRGLERIDDNVPEGQGVRLPAGALFALCGKSLLERIRSRPKDEPVERTTTQGDDHVD